MSGTFIPVQYGFFASFVVPLFAMAVGFVIFLVGSPRYRKVGEETKRTERREHRRREQRRREQRRTEKRTERREQREERRREQSSAVCIYDNSVCM